jgi:hypothetical protein
MKKMYPSYLHQCSDTLDNIMASRQSQEASGLFTKFVLCPHQGPVHLSSGKNLKEMNGYSERVMQGQSLSTLPMEVCLVFQIDYGLGTA